MRNIRRHKKEIVKTIGEKYLKKPKLNKKAFVCMDSKGADRYIEGFSDITSPPLSMPSSAKPSAAKDHMNQSNL